MVLLISFSEATFTLSHTSSFISSVFFFISSVHVHPFPLSPSFYPLFMFINFLCLLRSILCSCSFISSVFFFLSSIHVHMFINFLCLLRSILCSFSSISSVSFVLSSVHLHLFPLSPSFHPLFPPSFRNGTLPPPLTVERFRT